MLFRKKVMPERLQPAWQAFQAQAERVEQARSVLLSCLSFGRADPVPIEVGLDLLFDELTDVADDVPAWRVEEVEEVWQACSRSLDVVREQVPKSRAVVTATDEGDKLVIAVSKCVTPLDAWHDAERAWLDLRRRA